jgi:hypothetical protein
MRRVTAAGVVAAVADEHSLADRADFQFVGEAVGVYVLGTFFQGPVPSHKTTKPRPAVIWTSDVDAIPEAQFEGHVM